MLSQDFSLSSGVPPNPAEKPKKFKTMSTESRKVGDKTSERQENANIECTQYL